MRCSVAIAMLVAAAPALAGQAPYSAQSPDVSISHRDRFYTPDQFSNTVSVIDPAADRLVGRSGASSRNA